MQRCYKERGLMIVVVHSLSHVWFFVTPWTAACQASLSFTITWSLFKLMSIELVMASNRLLLLPYFPASGSFPMSQFLASGGQSIWASASALVLPMNIQDWFPLGLTGLISLQFKGLSRLFSSTTVQKHQFFSVQASLWFHINYRRWLHGITRWLNSITNSMDMS